MTGRPTFGDFLQAAHRQVGTVARRGETLGEKDVFDVSTNLSRLIHVMERCVADFTADYSDVSASRRLALSPWGRASADARDALARADRILARRPGPRPAGSAVSEPGRRLETAARSLAAGRDLLHTHFRIGLDGARQPHSDWAAVVTIWPVRQALLEEIGLLARRAAPLGAGVALSPSSARPGTMEARRRLNAACQWLWVASASVETASRAEPPTAGDRELLRAIPVNASPTRRLPDGSEPVSVVCEGVADTAERVRRASWGSAERAAWSPAMTVASLRQVAMASVITAENCRLVFAALADRTAQPGFERLGPDLSAAAEVLQRARASWFQVTQSLDRIATDARGYQSQAAAEAADLALWTGRLAHADSGWKLADGASSPARQPESLAARPEDLPVAVAAVHQASESLATLARAEQEQVREAARAGRFLVPTLSLPEILDIPRPFAKAPKKRVDLLLATYREAGEASREAAKATGELAIATKAPSRALAAARTAVEHDGDHPPGRPPKDPSNDAEERQESPGPVEQTLLDLGVTRPDLLEAGSRLDRASQRLIIDAATDAERAGRRVSSTAFSRSAGTAALVNHALASAEPRAAALLRRPARAEREDPQPEP